MKSCFFSTWARVFVLCILSVIPLVSADAINDTDFVITVDTTRNPSTGTATTTVSTNANSFKIPLAPSTAYNFEIDWNNDGVFDETYNATTPSSHFSILHDYGTPQVSQKIRIK
jgi:hypothetical protein